MATMETRTYVRGIGDRATADFVLVAEQPGRQEVERREPMVGPAGQNLNDCLHWASIDRSRCYITNFIKDLDNDLKYYFDQRKKSPLQPPGKAYLNILGHELSQTTGVIIAMGNAALWALTGRLGITNWRGSVVESTLLPGRKVVPTFHPATWTEEKLYRNPKLFLNRHMVVHDLKRARSELGYVEIRKTPRETIIRPTFDEAMSFMNECLQHARVWFDIETLGHEMSCISFAYDEHKAMCIPFVDQDGQYFTVEEERQIMLKISEILQSDAQKGGQNIIFDSHFIHDRYGIVTNNRDDTMIAQGLILPDYPKRLEFITSMWTDINYYKGDGKIWLQGGNDWDKGYEYNAYDSLACAAAFHKQMSELEEMGNQDAYRRQVELVEPLTYMMEHGVKIDLDGYRQAIEDNSKALTDTKAQIATIMGDINIASYQQLTNYFYKQKGAKPILNKKRAVTTDEFALVELAGYGYHEAQLILKWRGLDKLRSTYLNMDKIDKDGRMRASYNPVGTSYGRISSSRNIYGTGMNLQNLPEYIRTYFVADNGYIIYSIDLSQAENRLVAYIGNITPMIEAFESGKDVHRLTASLMFGIDYDDVPDAKRQEGKRAGHGMNYGYGPTSFARRYQVTLDYAQGIHKLYHNSYPQIRSGYWEYVERELRNNNRTLTTLFGRRIRFMQKMSEQLKNAAYSAIPQGTVGEMINERALKFIYYNEDPIFAPVEILTQTHDSIDFQIPLDLPLENHAYIIRQVIDSLEAPLFYRHKPIVIPCDLVINYCLNKKKGVEIKAPVLPKSIDELSTVLETSINRLVGVNRA